MAINVPPKDENSSLDPKNAPEGNKFNFHNALFSFVTFKEFLVLATTIVVLISLVKMLDTFITSLSALFTTAANLHSAPIAVVKTMDWHIIFLGSALILSVTTIVCFLLGSVFQKKGKAGEGEADGSVLSGARSGVTAATEAVKSVGDLIHGKKDDPK